MPRALSVNLRSAMNAPQTGEAIIQLLTIRHPSLPEHIRVCDAGEDIVSGGFTYQHFPFELGLPDDTDESDLSVQLTIANADRTISRAVRELQGEALKAELRIVAASDPDLVEIGPIVFTVRPITYSAEVVTATLAFEDVLNEPFPGGTFSPALFPGLA